MRISDWSSDVCSSDLQHLVDPLPHRILQFSIFAGLLAPGVERPAESGESEEPPKAGEQQSTDNRADDRGDQHQRGRRKFPQRPYQPAVRRMGLAGIMVVVGEIITPARARTDTDDRDQLPFRSEERSVRQGCVRTGRFWWSPMK